MARRLTLEFLKTESGAGLVLALAAIAALVAANSPWSANYFAAIGQPIAVRLGNFAETRDLTGWVKDGLMAIFFLVIGMEIKFEALRGELSSPRRIALPVLAAVGGLLVPALIYLAVNRGAGGDPRGWPVSAATDIAFALAALAVAAPRLPGAVRVFLLTVAIAEDLGAVGLIAALFTNRLDGDALAGAALGLLGLMGVSRWRRAPYLLYAAAFIVVWAFTLSSGVDTSIAGIACGFCVPAGPRRPGQESVLTYFIESLHPYVAYLILPLFAFTAAGVSLSAMRTGEGMAPAPVGLVLALAIGKPLGVFAFSGLAVALGLGRRPPGVTWAELAGAAMLCGVGFTMSLYIADLAFSAADAAMQTPIRVAILIGSLLPLAAGGALLAALQRRRLARGLTAWR
ncbi:MAG: Na+/H+ antiporter NhaA [Caulobacteraceae bacterium]